MNRVEVTRPVVGIARMQVCAVADATDEEILEVCNRENPSGTDNGWVTVMRDGEASAFDKSSWPVQCDTYPNRLHFLIVC